ncbi:MAG: aminotransferase class III-fold pyridoxal phosphate-dependent enzyme [Candidatus Aenigmarchaeota archaeon]|nr:aminotransferase class III-fold pyridoxal phosphate-dependent enzyme [Candidatus Aenigmarchaeota archaeon]
MEKFICRRPGPKSVRVISRDDKIVSPCVMREYSFVWKKAKGCYVYDVDGRKYLDFSAAIAVANVGHTNPVVMNAIKKQAGKLTHCGFSDFYAELPVEFCETLVSFLPQPLKKVFLSNSGTESIEAAYKLARWHTNRKWVIAFKNAFHGRTMGSLSMTNSRPVQRERYSPFLPVRHVPYPNPYRMGDCADQCLSELEKAMKSLKGECAALFMEPVQGEGGYVVPPKAFVKGARHLCSEHGVLLCADEVQAGCYRTGRFLAMENFGVKTVSSSKIMDWVPGSHGNTFGGNLLACAAGIATLKYMRQKRLGNNARRLGKLMLRRLNELKDEIEIIGDVRGLGLMIGVEIVENKRSKKPAPNIRSAILCKAAEKGLILLPAGKSVIRICPPLTLTRSQAEHGLDILEDACQYWHR